MINPFLVKSKECNESYSMTNGNHHTFVIVMTRPWEIEAQ